jgi:hypothetical protein
VSWEKSWELLIFCGSLFLRTLFSKEPRNWLWLGWELEIGARWERDDDGREEEESCVLSLGCAHEKRSFFFSPCSELMHGTLTPLF